MRRGLGLGAFVLAAQAAGLVLSVVLPLVGVGSGEPKFLLLWMLGWSLVYSAAVWMIASADPDEIEYSPLTWRTVAQGGTLFSFCCGCSTLTMAGQSVFNVFNAPTFRPNNAPLLVAPLIEALASSGLLIVLARVATRAGGLRLARFTRRMIAGVIVLALVSVFFHATAPRQSRSGAVSVQRHTTSVPGGGTQTITRLTFPDGTIIETDTQLSTGMAIQTKTRTIPPPRRPMSARQVAAVAIVVLALGMTALFIGLFRAYRRVLARTIPMANVLWRPKYDAKHY